LVKKKIQKLQQKEDRAKAREAFEIAKKTRNEAEDHEIAERKRLQEKEKELLRKEDEELEKIRQERKKT